MMFVFQNGFFRRHGSVITSQSTPAEARYYDLRQHLRAAMDKTSADVADDEQSPRIMS